MTEENSYLPDREITSVINNAFGKACCRQRVGRVRSLSLGFGKKIPHGRPGLSDDYYGEWEIGTYTASWRIVQYGNIVCGSGDLVDSISELDDKVSEIGITQITEISAISKFDIRVSFGADMWIDFMSATSDDDEIFHVFCPNDVYVDYSILDGWSLGSRSKA